MGNITFFVPAASTLPEGAYAHYVADDLSNVDSWPGHNGTGPTLSPTLNSGSITLNTGVNGHKYVAFTGGAVMGIALGIIIPASLTILCVQCRTVLEGEHIGEWSVGPETGYNTAIKAILNTYYGRYYLMGFRRDPLMDWIPSSYVPANEWRLVSVRYNSVLWDSKYGDFRINGIARSTKTTDPVTNSETPQGLRLGTPNWRYSSNPYIAEFVYYQGVLSDDDMTGAEAYLMNKYGIS